ncbi:MAG: 6,7-dimethyl-8-ribityllumazine synthase [Bacteroidia bacterium]|nr:6,7-dimethyl-8-ribityllumazine synthase [Bacteroidia bacterium]
MSVNLKHLSATTLDAAKTFKKFKIGMVVSEWNSEITFSMRDAAIEFMKAKGVSEKSIIVHSVPGAFELPLGAQYLAQQKRIDAIITIGCVIKGETKHFDFICHACASGITQVSLKYNKPVIFGVLTTNNLQQAQDRVGGKHGNKGVEAAETVLKMLQLQRSLEEM